MSIQQEGKAYEIWGCDSGVAEDSNALRYDAVSFGLYSSRHRNIPEDYNLQGKVSVCLKLSKHAGETNNLLVTLK
jgi:hypothetical protein